MRFKLIRYIVAVRIVDGFEFSAATDAFPNKRNSAARDEDSKNGSKHGQ